VAGSNSPKPILIYLAGPIDDVAPGIAKSWREDTALMFGENVVYFSPAHACLNITEVNFRAADFINRLVIDHCHGLLANFEGGEGFGTIREIEHARRSGTPVVILDPKGRFKRSMMTFDVEVCETVDEGMTRLLEIIAEVRNEPPTLMGIPVAQLRPMTDEEMEDQGGS
jgi:hypothetical protein